MESLNKLTVVIEALRVDLRTQLIETRNQALREGFKLGLGRKKPSQSDFHKEHSEPINYGEDFAVVVWARGRTRAAELLGCDLDTVEEMYLNWGAYNFEGEDHVGFYLNRSNDGEFHAYGIWL